jgi:hypothetical protein
LSPQQHAAKRRDSDAENEASAEQEKHVRFGLRRGEVRQTIADATAESSVPTEKFGHALVHSAAVVSWRSLPAVGHALARARLRMGKVRA